VVCVFFDETTNDVVAGNWCRERRIMRRECNGTRRLRSCYRIGDGILVLSCPFLMDGGRRGSG
jgi:hypothetical protein